MFYFIQDAWLPVPMIFPCSWVYVTALWHSPVEWELEGRSGEGSSYSHSCLDLVPTFLHGLLPWSSQLLEASPCSPPSGSPIPESQSTCPHCCTSQSLSPSASLSWHQHTWPGPWARRGTPVLRSVRAPCRRAPLPPAGTSSSPTLAVTPESQSWSFSLFLPFTKHSRPVPRGPCTCCSGWIALPSWKPGGCPPPLSLPPGLCSGFVCLVEEAFPNQLHQIVAGLSISVSLLCLIVLSSTYRHLRPPSVYMLGVSARCVIWVRVGLCGLSCCIWKRGQLERARVSDADRDRLLPLTGVWPRVYPHVPGHKTSDLWAQSEQWQVIGNVKFHIWKKILCVIAFLLIYTQMCRNWWLLDPKEAATHHHCKTSAQGSCFLAGFQDAVEERAGVLVIPRGEPWSTSWRQFPWHVQLVQQLQVWVLEPRPQHLLSA